MTLTQYFAIALLIYGLCAYYVIRGTLKDWDEFEKMMVEQDDGIIKIFGCIPPFMKALCLIVLGLMAPYFVFLRVRTFIICLPTELSILHSKFRIWRSKRRNARLDAELAEIRAQQKLIREQHGKISSQHAPDSWA
jgi:hypothetical protein